MRVRSKCTLNFANLRLKTLPVLRGDPDYWLRPIAMRSADCADQGGDHLLTGLLFDDAGHRMAPTQATKAGIRYRYYVPLPCLHGEGSARAYRRGPES